MPLHGGYYFKCNNIKYASPTFFNIRTAFSDIILALGIDMEIEEDLHRLTEKH